MANKIIQITDGTDNLYTKMPSQSTTATASSGWTLSRNVVRKSDIIISFSFEAKGGTFASGWNVIANLPTGYRPSDSIDFCGIDNTSGTGVQMQISGNGNVNVYYISGLHNNLRGFISFISPNNG